MRLSTQADYAIRIVLELAHRGEGSVVQTDAIARAQDLPQGRLVKVVQDLARAGIVRTRRGRSGGVMLARPAAELSVRDVYEAVEGPILMCRCQQRLEPCSQASCEMHAFWEGIEETLTTEFETVTFADLAAAAGTRYAAEVRSEATRR